jgi:hypothetical protein
MMLAFKVDDSDCSPPKCTGFIIVLLNYSLILHYSEFLKDFIIKSSLQEKYFQIKSHFISETKNNSVDESNKRNKTEDKR